jgi:hypothetical protein
VKINKQRVSVKDWRRAFQELVERIAASPGVVLFDAVEAGVPTYLVHVIADATGKTVSNIMDLIGVSLTTFRRKEEANEALPDVAGHRVMGFLRIAATLRKLLEESGDPQQLKEFDLESWVIHFGCAKSWPNWAGRHLRKCCVTQKDNARLKRYWNVCEADCPRDGLPLARCGGHASVDSRRHGGKGRGPQRRSMEPRSGASHLCCDFDLIGCLGDASPLWTREEVALEPVSRSHRGAG